MGHFFTFKEHKHSVVFYTMNSIKGEAQSIRQMNQFDQYTPIVLLQQQQNIQTIILMK